ncbi:Asp-tRNA(Asn)/Glu-tRNA(Gln) amidotransferase subunit GatA [Roseivirga sp. BDSF3-8]|uniref:Asp-tRNA(Asn)/Glu-tRNA(Gln) amidotransferase subunit GatA n=1 Tax=Roseivirga sp. BDSF3-8 TaxID=3241598 RepID=UPI00353229FD
MRYDSLSEIRKDIEAGTTSCEKLVEHYLKNIREKAHLNVFLEVYAEEAREAARRVDQRIADGTAGKLAGMVVGLKDVLCHKDHGLQSSSRILDGFVSQFNGTAVDRLLKEDAIVIGRQSCDEFAMGSSNENSAFGAVLNADDESRVPGGSSGASAVSVQADMCLLSLGSDTGGSVRQPAAFCGVYGLKPTYSRISRYGLVAYASSFDTIGVFSRSIQDCALMLEVIAGADEQDSTVSREGVPAYSRHLDNNRTYRIAYIANTLDHDGLSEEVKDATLRKIALLKEQGHSVEPVEFSLLDYVLPTYYILTTAEASSNLSRYDGVKYGYRSENGHDLETMYKLTRSEGFGEEVKRRIMLGTFVLSASYYDAYYTKAQKVRRLICDETAKLLEEYDFLISPTTPTTAFGLGEHSDNPLEMYLADLYTVQASVSGIPAISVPVGRDGDGLSIGLQVMAGSFKEQDLLAFAKYLGAVSVSDKTSNYTLCK